jgi:adenylate cyclase class 2
MMPLPAIVLFRERRSSGMTIEVEHKYRVADAASLQGRLAELQAKVDEPQLQVDAYFAHPARDFAVTDEALRIRRVGERNWITYKGPKLDAATKTRREIELPLEGGSSAASAFAELLQVLGFKPVREVRKHRRRVEIPWQGRQVEAALDDVEGLGQFIELELVVDQRDVLAAQACLASLAQRLQLAGGERRSYLELLLDASSARAQAENRTTAAT